MVKKTYPLLLNGLMLFSTWHVNADSGLFAWIKSKFASAQDAAFSPPTDKKEAEQIMHTSQEAFLNWGMSGRQGKRKTMEDDFEAIFDKTPEAKLAFFGIYDGHDGNTTAQLLAGHCGQCRTLYMLPAGYSSLGYTILQHVHANKQVTHKMLVDSYNKVDNMLEKHNVPAGSTAVTALIIKDANKKYATLDIAWVADSRAVLVSKKGTVITATKDHKPDSPSERKRIEAAGGVVLWPHGIARIGGVFSLSRSLGDIEFKKTIEGFIATPDTISTRIDGKTKALILACDGVFDVLSSEDAARIVSQALDDFKQPLKQYPNDAGTFEQSEEDGNSDRAIYAARMLRDAAYKKGSTDNISVLVVDLESLVSSHKSAKR